MYEVGSGSIPDDQLIYLDPHVTQPTVQVSEDGSIPDDTYHCLEAQRMRISELDPSVALVGVCSLCDGFISGACLLTVQGFFCKDEADFDDLVKRLREVSY